MCFKVESRSIRSRHQALIRTGGERRREVVFGDYSTGAAAFTVLVRLLRTGGLHDLFRHSYVAPIFR